MTDKRPDQRQGMKQFRSAQFCDKVTKAIGLGMTMSDDGKTVAKWILGSFALLCAYQFGYTNGREAPPAPIQIPVAASAPAILQTDSIKPAPPERETAATPGPAATTYPDEALTEAAPNGNPYVSDSIIPSESTAPPAADNPANGSDRDDPAATKGAPAPQSGPVAAPARWAAATYDPPSPAPSAVATAIGAGCGENGSCYGDVSAATGLPKTTYVRGYFRSDGTYVRSHYRSRR